MTSDVIMFTGPACSACRSMYPLVKEYDNIRIVDVTEDPTMAAAYNVRSLPTFIRWSNGEMAEFRVGSMRAKELEAFVK